MDLDTARKQRERLQKELDAFSSHGTAISIAPMLLAMEIYRMDQSIAMRLFDPNDSETKIEVENPLMMLNVWSEFGLEDLPSIEVFRKHIIAELPLIKNFHQPLPLTAQFTLRVLERLDEEITRQREYMESIRRICAENQQGNDTGESSGSASEPREKWTPPPRSRFWHENLDNSIKDAINAVIEKNPEGASSEQVLDILRQNGSIQNQINDNVISVVRQRYFEATFTLNSKSAAGDHGEVSQKKD